MAIKSTDRPAFVDLTEGREAVVNGVATSGYWGSQHVVVLISNRAGAGPNGTLRSEAAIVARLRFDTDMARKLRDQLNEMIAAVSTPPGEAPN